MIKKKEREKDLNWNQQTIESIRVGQRLKFKEKRHKKERETEK